MSQRGGDGSIKFTNLKIMNSKMIEKSQFNVGEKLNLLISLKSIEKGLINSNLAIKVIIKIMEELMLNGSIAIIVHTNKLEINRISKFLLTEWG